MQGLIIYASRMGSTSSIASKLASSIKNHKFDTQDITKEKQVDMTNYDIIVIGSYMRRQLIDPTIQNFVEKYKEDLPKKAGLFIFVTAGETGETYRREVRNSFPKEILAEIEVINLGANINPQKINFVEKVMLQEMAKRQGKLVENLSNYNEAKLLELAKKIDLVKEPKKSKS